ncbi:MAG: TonB-dependent receptor [Bacteroidia bacterium]
MKRITFIWMFLCFVKAFSQTDTLETVTVEAEKNLKPSSAQKILSFSQEQLSALSQKSLGELLAKSSSVYIKSYGQGSLATPSVRGTGANHTQVFWNGVNINSPTLGQSDLSLLPLIFINQAELHLGSSSLIDGSGGIGGSIRLNNETNYFKGENIEFTKELGSFGYGSSGLKIGLGNGFLQSVTTLYQSQAKNNFTYRDLSQKERPFVAQTNNYLEQMGLGQDVSLRFKQNEIDFKSLVFSSFREIPANIGSMSDAFQKDVSQKYLLSLNRVQNKSSHTLKVAMVADDLNYVNNLANIDANYNTQSLSAIYNGVFYFDKIKVKTFLLNQNDAALSDGFTETTYRNKHAAFVTLEHSVSKQFLYYVSIREEVIDTLVAPISPSLGAKYSINDCHHFSVNAAKTFRAPTLNDLYWSVGGNPNLLPEIAYTFELMYSFTKNKFNASITAYYSQVDNWIQWTPTRYGYWSPKNIKLVENKGVELHFNYVIYEEKVSRLNVGGNYSYTSSTSLKSNVEGDNSVGKQLIYAPQHTCNFNIFYTYKKLSVNYLQTYTGKVFIDAQNTTYMPYFAPADASIHYAFTSKESIASIGFRVQNIFNEAYQIIANRPLPMRSIYVVLKISFKS